MRYKNEVSFHVVIQNVTCLVIRLIVNWLVHKAIEALVKEPDVIETVFPQLMCT